MGLVCWRNRSGGLGHRNGVTKGKTAEDEVQEVVEPGHPGLCSHCRGFLGAMEATWRFDRGGIYSIGSYRIRLVAMLRIY